MSIDGPNDDDGPLAQYNSFWLVIIVFISIALYNVVELNFLIATTFKKYRGLYFWSFTCSTWGVALNAVGYLLRLLRPERLGYLNATLILIGWCSMITGQSLVLYSRLHIVLQDSKRLHLVLGMIIFNAIWLGIPVIVLVYGTNSNNPTPFTKPYSIFEKLQLTVFFVQEVVISSLYIVETTRLLKMQRGIGSSATRRVMGHLILVNIFVVLLDVSILCLEFTEHYNIQTAWKALVYSVKLKAEFSVLNRLVEFSQHLRSGRNMSGNPGTSSDVALETYLRNASQAPIGAEYSMEVTAERPCESSSRPLGGVVKTTAVTVSHGRRQLTPPRSSTGANSLDGTGGGTAEEAHDVDGTSSLSSEAHLARKR